MFKNFNIKIILIFFNFCFPSLLQAYGQEVTRRIYIDYKLSDNILIINTNDGDISLHPYSDSIIEVTFTPHNNYDKNLSDAVVMKPNVNDFKLSENVDNLVYESSGMKIVINKNPLNISYLKNNKVILQEELGFYRSPKSVAVRMKIFGDEKFYGSGARTSGLNLRGRHLSLYNRANYAYEIGENDLNYTLPLLVSSNKYLLLFDNPQKGYIDIDSNHDNVLEFSAIGGVMRYYLIIGSNYESLLSQYYMLTGSQPMLPLWAYGNLMSRMAYRTQNETDSIVSLMLEEDFPADAVILDFYWFGDSIKGHLGRLDWYKPSWHNPDSMINDFKSKGIKTVLISEPYIIDSMDNYKIAAELDIFVKDSLGNDYLDTNFYFGNGSLIDIFKPEAAEWLWQQYKRQFNQGVEGLWGDLGEPESHPDDLRHSVGRAEEVHNLYGHYWVKGIYERFRRDFPEKRLFFLARSGAAGTQRYGIVPWSGDVRRSWGGLQAQIPAMLNMSLSGIPYFHSDAGGFALGVKDNELYTRWLQFAVFSPILRPHGSDIPSEPVYFNDTAKRIVRSFMKLRYELLPYIYTTAWQNSEMLKPFTAPIFFYHPDEQRFTQDSSGYFFGRDILVYPVTKPHVKDMIVNLPQGTWYNFWNGKQYIGNQDFKLYFGIEKIPVFARGGSVIPMTDYVRSTDYYSSDKLYLHTYLPQGNGSVFGEIYMDDGKTYNSFEKDEYQLITIEGNNIDNEFNIYLRAVGNGYQGMPVNRIIEFIIYGYKDNINQILINKKSIKEKKYSSRKIKDSYWKDEKGFWHIRLNYSAEALHISIL